MRKGTKRITVVVTAQSYYHLRHLADMAGYNSIGRVIDKLVREHQLAMRGGYTTVGSQGQSLDAPRLPSSNGGERCQMRPISEIKANYRLRIVSSGEDGFAAYINHPCYKPTAIAVIASWGGGWEHVSVSLARRCPTWEEMCMVKDIFWGEEECVVQFHPPRSEYVNRHPYCLHLWKKIGEEYETPPKEYVG